MSATTAKLSQEELIKAIETMSVLDLAELVKGSGEGLVGVAEENSKELRGLVELVGQAGEGMKVVGELEGKLAGEKERYAFFFVVSSIYVVLDWLSFGAKLSWM